jgi:hypothetical protein
MEVSKMLAAVFSNSAEAERVGNIIVPVDMGGHRNVFALMGLSFGDLVENQPTLIHAQLPFGWDVDSFGPFRYIVDQAGRKRGIIFRKVAGTDLYQMLPVKRLTVREGQNSTGYAYASVLDGDEPLYSVLEPIPGPHDNAWKAREHAKEMVLRWLMENFPEWEDPAAYWDQDNLMM